MPRTGAKAVPVDTAEADDHTFNQADYEKADQRGRELRDRILASPEARNAYDRAVGEIDQHQLTLAKLRRARNLAQAAVAEAMDMQQSEVSRLERRTDFLISTLRKFIEATGGELVMVARYPEGDVQVAVPGEKLLEDA